MRENRTSSRPLGPAVSDSCSMFPPRNEPGGPIVIPIRDKSPLWKWYRLLKSLRARISPSDYKVAMDLWDRFRYEDGGWCRVTRGWIAKAIGLSKRTVSRALRTLVELGLVIVESGRRRHEASRYFPAFGFRCAGQERHTTSDSGVSPLSHPELKTERTYESSRPAPPAGALRPPAVGPLVDRAVRSIQNAVLGVAPLPRTKLDEPVGVWRQRRLTQLRGLLSLAGGT